MLHKRAIGWISDGPIKFMCFHFKSSPSKQDQFEKGEQPGKWTKFPEIKTEFPKVFSLTLKFPKVSCQCRYFWHNELQHIPRKPLLSLPMPHNFAFTRVKLQLLSLFCSWQTLIIQDCGHRWNVINFSGLCYCDRTACRSYCSFCVCVCCHSVCGSVKKDKGQGFEIRTPVPSFFTRIFPWHIYLEVVTLYTKLIVIGEYNKGQRG